VLAFLSFFCPSKVTKNAVCQMKRGNVVVKKGFTISDEGDIPDALLLYRRLALLCFRYFVYSHECITQKWVTPASSPLLGKVLCILRKG
jgi:hypothetical protein